MPRVSYNEQKINLTTVFAGYIVGMKEAAGKIRLVSFMKHDPGFVDHETCRLESVGNPFDTKVLPMSPVWTSTICRPGAQILGQGNKIGGHSWPFPRCFLENADDGTGVLVRNLG